MTTLDHSMRYERHIDSRFEELLAPEGRLNFIIDEARQEVFRDAGIPLDLQFREKNKATLYLGLTKLLDIEIKKRAQKPIRLTADTSYKIGRFRLNRPYGLDSKQGELLRSLMRKYLDSVKVSPHQYRREGATQNTLSYSLGMKWKRSQPALIDREVVIGYTSTEEQTRHLRPIKQLTRKLGQKLAKSDPKRFGTRLGQKNVGNELDCLCWHPDRNELWITEVKHGSDTKGVYLSPRQVACYRAIWQDFVTEQEDDAIKGIRLLIKQKQRLGLLPRSLKLPRTTAELQLRPVIVIEAPNWRSSCWESFRIVQDTVNTQWNLHCPDNKPILDGLEVYEWNRNTGLVDITSCIGCRCK